MSEAYTPFQKPFEQLAPVDLQVLRSVHEGWYIEYKGRVPNSSSIAKSVTAFANTYGGFLFYGVIEKSREDNVAGEFQGVPDENLQGELEKIRQAIAAHSAPDPHFEVRVLSGPCDEIGLEAGTSIICLHVPWSARAPHVHKSGVIYRRVSDSSEPAAENDRHRLGELFGRSQEIIRNYKEWYDNDPPLTESERNHPYLRIMLKADPWREGAPWLGANVGAIRDCFNLTGRRPTLPFDSIQTTRNGVLARQTSGNGLADLTLTWALNRDLTSEIIVPIPLVTFSKAYDSAEHFDGYLYGGEFCALLASQKSDRVDVLDLNQLYPIFTGIFEILDSISDAAQWRNGYQGTFKVLNAHRAAPFIDVQSVVERYRRTGVPIFLPLLGTFDQAFHPDSFISFDSIDEEDKIVPAVNAVVLMIHLARALGLPVWEDPKEDLDFYQHLAEAGARSLAAQTLRNQRNRA